MNENMNNVNEIDVEFKEVEMNEKKSVIDMVKGFGGKVKDAGSKAWNKVKENPEDTVMYGIAGLGAVCMAVITGASISSINQEKKDYSRLIDASIEHLNDSSDQDNEIKIKLSMDNK